MTGKSRMGNMKSTLRATTNTLKVGGKNKETHPDTEAHPDTSLATDTPIATEVDITPLEPKPIRPLENRKVVDKNLVTVNIKITRTQQDWLADTARQVRDNNTSPVPAGDRVYPQHLIQVAIDLLQNAGVDWSTIKNTAELKDSLNL